MAKKIEDYEASREVERRIQQYLEGTFFKQVSSIRPESFPNPKILKLDRIEEILDDLERTEYFSRSSYGGRDKLQRGYNYDVTLSGDNGDKTRTIKVNLGRAYFGGYQFVLRRKRQDFGGISNLEQLFPGILFFKQLESAWSLLTDIEPDLLNIVGQPDKREVIMYKAVESDNGILRPDFEVDDPGGYGERCYQRIVEPTAIRYTYQTDNQKYPCIYFLFSPTNRQSDLAEKAISYKPETIDGFRPCTTF